MDKTDALIVEFKSASRIAADFLGIKGHGADFEALSFLRQRYLNAFKVCGMHRANPEDVATAIKERIGSRFRSYRRNLANFTGSFPGHTLDIAAMNVAVILGTDVRFSDMKNSDFNRACALYLQSEHLIDYGVTQDGATPDPSALYLAHIFGLERLSFIQENVSASPKADAEKALRNQIPNIRLFAIPATAIGAGLLQKAREVEDDIAACLFGPPLLNAPPLEKDKDTGRSDRASVAEVRFRERRAPFLTVIDGGRGPS